MVRQMTAMCVSVKGEGNATHSSMTEQCGGRHLGRWGVDLRSCELGRTVACRKCHVFMCSHMVRVAFLWHIFSDSTIKMI